MEVGRLELVTLLIRRQKSSLNDLLTKVTKSVLYICVHLHNISLPACNRPDPGLWAVTLSMLDQ